MGAQILADSLSPDGVRLTTFQLTYPRIIHAEMMTHRVFSRNAASSRAIPVKKMIASVMDEPYVPMSWGKNQKGMQAGEEVDADARGDANDAWLSARDAAVEYAKELLDVGIHKQLTNRLLEPFLWYTAIFTATEWSNFFHLRNNAAAHPDIATIAAMMQELYEELEPTPLRYGDWHLPLVSKEERFNTSRYLAAGIHGGATQADIDKAVQELVKISVGRCARVSYLTHEGKRDPQADIDLHDRLLKSGHMSPFEHVARPATPEDAYTATVKLADVKLTRKNQGDGGTLFHVSPEDQWHGNFRGFVQYRKTIPNESDIMGSK